MIKKIILVGFNNSILSDSLMWLNINKWKYTNHTKTDIHLREYAHYFTQLYKNNWVFFDYIFKSIERGISENDNIKNIDKIRESWVIDCYPLLMTRINKLLNIGQWCLIISNIENNTYDYLIDLLDCKKVYLGSELEVINYIQNFNRV